MSKGYPVTVSDGKKWENISYRFQVLTTVKKIGWLMSEGICKTSGPEYKLANRRF